MLNETWECPECNGVGKQGGFNCRRCNGDGKLSRKVKPDLRIVALDETRYWREDIQEVAGKIVRLYLVDWNERTYICSATPNVFLWHMYGETQGEVNDDDLWIDIYNGAGEESDYFSPWDIEGNFVDRIDGEDLETLLKNNAWESESGYREMIDNLCQAYRENPLWNTELAKVLSGGEMEAQNE